MPELKSFSHIDLTVSDRDRAAAWWQDVMGFTVVSRWRGDSFDVIALMARSTIQTRTGVRILYLPMTTKTVRRKPKKPFAAEYALLAELGLRRK